MSNNRIKTTINFKKITISILLLLLFQNVEAQQHDYDKLILKTLNELEIYKDESNSISKILNDKIGFYQGSITQQFQEFRKSNFSDEEVTHWRDSIKQATNTLNNYSKEYIYDIKNKYVEYPYLVFNEEVEKKELEKEILDLKETFKSRTDKFRKEKIYIENLKYIAHFLEKYAAVGDTFRANGREKYYSRMGKYEKKLPAGDYIITNNKKMVFVKGKEKWTLELKSNKKNKIYSLITQAEDYTTMVRDRKDILTNFIEKFIDFQNKVQELEGQLDYSKSPEKPQVDKIEEKIKELDIKIDSLRNIPNPYYDDYRKFIDLAQILEKGKVVLEKAISHKDSQHRALKQQQREQQNKARTAEYEKKLKQNKAEQERRKNNLISRYGKETGTNIYNKKYWIGMKEEYLKAGEYSVTLVHRDGNTRVYRYADIDFMFNVTYKYIIFKNRKLTSLVDNFTINN